MKRLRQKLILIVALVVAATLVSGQVVSAQGSGAIWTTTGSCGEPQNINHYSPGDNVFINGAGFPAGEYGWDITGLPGGASNHPNIAVASGNQSVDESGAFCFLAYTIGQADGGTYQARFGNKFDNYRVIGDVEPTPIPTEEPPVEPTPVPTEEPPVEPTPVPTQDPEGEPPPTIAQSTPAPVIAPTTGAASGPAALIATAASSLGLSGLSFGVWLKRRKS